MPKDQQTENTTKKRVLFFSLNSPGHINSSLGIADILKERGFDTIFMTLGPMLVANVKQNGHKVVTIDDTTPYIDTDDNNREYVGATKWPIIIQKCRKYFVKSPLEAWTQTVDLCDGIMIDDLINNNDKYHEAIEDIDPDVIVLDMYYVPACVVSNKRPWVRVYSANPLNLIRSDDCPPSMGGFSVLPKDLARTDPEKWSEHKQKWDHFKKETRICLKVFRDRWNTYLQSMGCPTLEENVQTHDSPHVNLYMFPKCIDYDDVHSYPPRWLRCDSLIRKTTNSVCGANDPMQQLIATTRQLGKKLIFFSMGSLVSGDVNTMKNLIAILAKSPHQFIVSKGVNGDEYELSDNMWGEKFVSQTSALEQADMAVIHGGNNTITECFYFGCPMVVLPAFADQLDNGQRIEDKGFGKRMNPYFPKEDELLQAIEEILNDKELSNKMKEISKEMRSRNGAQKGANLIEILAHEGRLDDDVIDKFRDI